MSIVGRGSVSNNVMCQCVRQCVILVCQCTVSVRQRVCHVSVSDSVPCQRVTQCVVSVCQIVCRVSV